MNNADCCESAPTQDKSSSLKLNHCLKTISLALQMPPWHTTHMSKPIKQQKQNRSPKENQLTQYLVTESAREGGVPDAATRAQLSVLMSASELVSEPKPKSRKKRKSSAARMRPSNNKKRK
jgi:hypothetical protein